MNNDVVIIELDRPRELRYGHKALKMLVALTGKSLEEIEQGGFDDFELVEKIAYCGLLKDARDNGETLKLEQIEDLLDEAPNYKHIVERVQAAFFAAFGVPVGAEGNSQVPADQLANEEALTSKKA